MVSNAEYLQQFIVNRAILKQIKSKHHVNKLLFEVITQSYLLQTKSKPYFYVPDLLIALPSLNTGRVYDSVHSLVSLSLVLCSFSHRNRINADQYCITGKGLNVLQSYCNQVRYRLGLTQHKPL